MTQSELQLLNETSTFQYNLVKKGPGSSRAIQSVDEAHGNLFSLHVNSSSPDQFAIINKYNGSDASTLTSVRYTKDVYPSVGHQGLTYEKTVTKTKTDGNGNTYTATVDIFWSSKMRDEDKIVRFEVWDDPQDSSNLLVGNLQEVVVWPEDGGAGSASPSISLDGQYMVVEDVDNASGRIRVFELYDLTNSNGNLVEADPIHEFYLGSESLPVPKPGGGYTARPLQAVASDGEFIYVISGYGGANDPKSFAKYTLDGTRLAYNTFEIGDTGGHLEPEGLFFTENGQLAVSVSTGGSPRVNKIFYVGDTLGTDANDTLNGDDRDNVLYGFDGNDKLFAYDGDDRLHGGSGNDRLYGGTGDDVLYGGSGNDYLRDDSGHDKFYGGNGIDEVSYWGHKTGMTVNLATGANTGGDQYFDIENILGSNTANDNLTGDDGANKIRGASGNDKLFGGKGNDTLEGGTGDDRLYGEAGRDGLDGGDGNDYLRDESGGTTFNGGAGVDVVSYWGHANGVTVNLETGVNSENDSYSGIENLLGSNKANDHLTGNASENLIQGAAGNDHLFGRAGNDTLEGGAGNDRLYGGSGNDQLIGGDGNDYLRDENGRDIFIGGNGTDEVSYWGHKTGMTVNLSTGTNSGADTYDSIENLLGSNIAADHLTGTNGANKINGAAGNDTLFGLGGNDTLLGDAGNDRLYGGKGNDRLEGGSGNDYLRDDSGHDKFYGGDGIDEVSYWGHTKGMTVNLATGENSGGDQYFDIENILGSNKAADILTGDDGANKIRGAAGNDRLNGDHGDDRLEGGIGNDILYGNGHNDDLFGGDGNDFLDGGQQNDRLYGGLGEDTFHFDRSEDHDVVMDFENNIDVIELDGFESIFTTKDAAFGYAQQVGSDVVFDFGQGDILTISDTTIGYLRNDLELV